MKVFVHNKSHEDFYFEWHGNGYPKAGNFPPDDKYSKPREKFKLYIGESKNSLNIGHQDCEVFDDDDNDECETSTYQTSEQRDDWHIDQIHEQMYTGECRNSLEIGQHDLELLDEQVVYGDDSLLHADDDDEHETSTNYVSINVPLSFAMAANFDARTTNEIEGEEEDNIEINNDYYTHYGVDEAPKRLISKFVDLLEKHAKKYKQLMFDKYYDMIEHIQQWFLEKGMEVNLLSTDGLDDTEPLCTLLDIPVANTDNGEIEYMKKDYNLIAYGNELQLVQRLKKFLTYYQFSVSTAAAMIFH